MMMMSLFPAARLPQQLSKTVEPKQNVVRRLFEKITICTKPSDEYPMERNASNTSTFHVCRTDSQQQSQNSAVPSQSKHTNKSPRGACDNFRLILYRLYTVDVVFTRHVMCGQQMNNRTHYQTCDEQSN